MIIKEMNDPTLTINDTVRLRVPPQYKTQQTRAFDFKIIEGTCTVLEIDNKRLLEKL